MMPSNPAFAVQEHGQSLWLDYIHRAELQNGDFQRRIDEEGIVGVTSNPSIFQKAIGEAEIYDETIQQHIELDAEALYEHLAVQDIRAAADHLLPVYERTARRDGYVSLEVSPLLANSSEETVAEAKRLAALVDRPNLMVKIPGTAAGLSAIEETIAAGISVNVTLLFSIKNYEEVAKAYIQGLERRLQAGEPIEHIASVASFFLSRIDTAVDHILENNIRAAKVHGDTARMGANRRLLGQAAVASARLAYQTFRRIFGTQRFNSLREQGAQVQRLLWASTSTKNPAYSDTMYVDNLIAPDTVNTLPPKTLAAFIDHGTVSNSLLQDNPDFLPPDELMDKLAELQIDMEQITHRLQVDGVDAFTESFRRMIEQIEAKLTVLRSGVMDRQKVALGIYSRAYEKTLGIIDKKFVNGRIWSKDGSLWKDHGPTISKIQQRLGWLDVLETMDLERLHALQDSIKHKDEFQHVLLLGMGGSSLAPHVLWKTFGQQEGFPDFHTLDSTDPDRIHQLTRQLDLSKTLFLVSSKSGTTLETMAFFHYFWQQSGANGQQFIAITDEGTPLAKLAAERDFRDVYLNPEDIGGRYSALSYVGLVPAALMGLDLERFWEHARLMIDASHENIPGQHHPGISLGALIGTLAKEGRDKVTIYATESLRYFGDWAEQLLAESLGKDRQGVVPVVGESIGSPVDYGTDRLFVFLRMLTDPDSDKVRNSIRSLREAGHPRATLRVPDKYALAGEFFRWEFATAVAGYVMGVNPFDEPNVAEAKEATRAMLEHYQQEGELPSSTPIMTGEHVRLYSDDYTLDPLREMCRAHGYDPNSRREVLAAQIAGTRSRDYFALLCYFTPDTVTRATLEMIQQRLRAVTRRAVTIGYGPRYLHSTGQLHKGGEDNGIYFIITTNRQHDIDIPELGYSFGTLFQAQAEGDMQTLQKHKRRVIRLHIEGDTNNGLMKLTDAIKVMESRRF